MRQRFQSPADTKLRTALENMRYAACTASDIQFLRTRIAGKRKDQPNIASSLFRNVSIILGLNSEKDKINDLGCQRFAKDTGQTLTNFYSVDTIGESVPPETLRLLKRKNPQAKTIRKKQVSLPSKLQNILWNMRYSMTETVPGKLSLCFEMPVMIRNNDATELCITRGQEAHVVGWQASKGAENHLVLDVLFVKLDSPAKTIQLKGLPQNVVPLTRSSKSVLCSGLKSPISINRSQVSVLPNFAMTDYASQGKTREYNVVNLNSCRSHMAYYTALSRGSTAEGTIILQGFDDHKITCGISGYLRQEFRELELLDEITRLKYLDQLPTSITGNLRNIIIRQYQQIKGTGYCPPCIDKALQWSKEKPMENTAAVKDSPWTIINKKPVVSKAKTFVAQHFQPAKGSIPVKVNNLKRKIEDTEIPIVPLEAKKIIKTKKPKITYDIELQGLKWDSVNYSCSYDSLFTILFNLWSQNKKQWTKELSQYGEFTQTLVKGYKNVQTGSQTLSAVRDLVRHELKTSQPDKFPIGHTGTDIRDLLQSMFQKPNQKDISYEKCSDC
ncbi:hypothetical protein GALMADRAFT_22667, partial [Galerina marginata CBS 339.88]